jgi:propanol-preferring alcohol dehydrogenase
MKAMTLREITSLEENQTHLSLEEKAEPKIADGEVLLRATRCGVCHTELDEIEGRTPPP